MMRYLSILSLLLAFGCARQNVTLTAPPVRNDSYVFKGYSSAPGMVPATAQNRADAEEMALMLTEGDIARFRKGITVTVKPFDYSNANYSNLRGDVLRSMIRYELLGATVLCSVTIPSSMVVRPDNTRTIVVRDGIKRPVNFNDPYAVRAAYLSIIETALQGIIRAEVKAGTLPGSTVHLRFLYLDYSLEGDDDHIRIEYAIDRTR